MKNRFSFNWMAAVVLGLAASAAPSAVQAQGPLRLGTRPFATGLVGPVDIVAAPGDSTHLYVVERRGRIRLVDSSGVVAATPFLDIIARVGSSGQEQGLLGLAFHPNYATNGYFYVNYTNLQGDTRIARFSRGATPSVADPASELTLLGVGQPYSNHNGGSMKFGPDGYLYCGLGDGGSGGDPGNRAQNKNTLLGKILRLDVDTTTATTPYGIPPDNPLVGQSNVRQEVWAWGVRNPWRFSFDRATGDFWIGEVGQNQWEEIDVVPLNDTSSLPMNFGWRCYEGNHSFNTASCMAATAYRPPVFEYPHSNATGGFSVTGGFVYQGTRYPTLRERYVFTDYVSGHLWVTSPDTLQPGSYVTEMDPLTVTGISAFGEDTRGELYCTLLSAGTIVRLTASGGTVLNPPPPLANPATVPAALPLAVWPNPAQATCRVSGAGASALVEVISLVTGQAVRQVKADRSGSATLDVHGLPPGLYGVRAADRNGSRPRLARLVVGASE